MLGPLCREAWILSFTSAPAGPKGEQSDRKAEVASPICIILGSSSATHATVTAVESVIPKGALPCHVLDHVFKLYQIPVYLQQTWKEMAW